MGINTINSILITTLYIFAFQTQYYVNVDVTPKPENKTCIVGYLSDLSIEFRKVQNNSDTQNENGQLLYEIQADGAMWGLCGKTVGMLFYLKFI